MITAAKEALARMLVVDVGVMQKQRTSGYGCGRDDDLVGGLETKPAARTNDKGGNLLDLGDILGGSGASTSQLPSVSISQNAVISSGLL